MENSFQLQKDVGSFLVTIITFTLVTLTHSIRKIF